MLGQEAMKESYYRAIKDWPKSQLNKLTIDLGIEKSREQSSSEDSEALVKVDQTAVQAKIDEIKSEMDVAAGKLNIPTAIPENGKEEEDLLLDSIEKNLKDTTEVPKVDSIEERVSTDPNCAIPSVVDNAAEETGSADKPMVEETADLAVKAVSEDAVLGVVSLDQAKDESQQCPV